MRKIILVALMVLAVFCSEVAANPGIIVEIDPGIGTGAPGTTVDYTMTVTAEPLDVEVTFVSFDGLPTGWTATVDPSIVGQTIPGGQDIQTTVHVQIPSDASGNVPIVAKVVGEEIICFDDFCAGTYVFMETQFWTDVTPPIPEFPTAAIPAVGSMLGYLLMRRRQ